VAGQTGISGKFGVDLAASLFIRRYRAILVKKTPAATNNVYGTTIMRRNAKLTVETAPSQTFRLLAW
jgi:hypothetical protein